MVADRDAADDPVANEGEEEGGGDVAVPQVDPLVLLLQYLDVPFKRHPLFVVVEKPERLGCCFPICSQNFTLFIRVWEP